MNKWLKASLILLTVLFFLAVATWLLIAAMWGGAFNALSPREIAAYESPDGKYTLVFEQMGDPGWPFGSAEVRLTVKNEDGKHIASASSYVANDGGNAHEGNIVAIHWGENEVVVMLDAEEMPAKNISLPLTKK